ncbi:hypothetical protein IJT10_07085, partial [bacterium]|nr:hypothetical protein [bacterium]
MRKNIFSWMAIAICAAAATGCGSSGSDATSYVVPSIPGVSASEKLVTFSVKDYEKTDNCRLVISTVGKSEDDTAAKRVYVSSDTSYAEPDAAVASAKIAQERTKKIDSKPSACGFSAVLHKVAPAQLVTSYKDDNPGVDDSKVRFLEPQDNAEPSVDFIWATFNGENKQVPVCKVLKDSETVHCNIISYAVTDSRGIYQPVVSVEDAKMIAELFDSYNPNDPTGKNRGIYEQITTEIGHEWIKNGGRDGDPKVNIILLPNDLMVVSSGGGSDESTESDSSGDSTSTDAKIRVLAANDEGSEEEIIYGAVNPLDEFVPVEGNNPNYSNGGEFIYINYEALLADNSNGMTKVDLATTLAHQFTHLVQLNASVCHDGRFGTVANDGGGIYSLAD